LKLLTRLFDPQYILRKQDLTGVSLPSGREAVGNLFRIAWPSVLESVLISLTALVDTAMVGTISAPAIAAVGLTNQPRLLVLAIFTAMNTGITALLSRRKGENDRDSANRILRQALLYTLLLTVPVSFLSVYFAEDILLFAGAGADYIDMATQYFQITMGCIFFHVISLVINAAQKGCGNTQVSMKANITANVVNIIFNYLLIGGNLGFPQLGVAGAAIATTIGYAAACVISLLSVCHKDQFLHLDLHLSFLPDRKTLVSLCKVASSVFLELVFLRFSFFIFGKIVAALGTIPFATYQICLGIVTVALGLGDGLAVATGALAGQSLGRKQPVVAYLYGLISKRFGIIAGALLAIIFLLLRNVIMIPFTDDPRVIALGAQTVIALAFTIPFQTLQAVFSVFLRIVGDTKYVAMISVIFITSIQIIGSYILCTTLGWGLVGAWIGFGVDQAVRFSFHLARFSKGKWTSIKL